ncbi:MAG: hypothetical protein ACOY4K_15715 [Pseudomonadota bacterium]
MRSILFACLLLAAGPAAAQSQTADAFAWRSFEACNAVFMGQPKEAAAREAGYRYDNGEWKAEVDGHSFLFASGPIPRLEGAQICTVTVVAPMSPTGPLAGQLRDWARREGFSVMKPSTSAAGGDLIGYEERAGEGRRAGLAQYPEGNPEQPARTTLFMNWPPRRLR